MPFFRLFILFGFLLVSFPATAQMSASEKKAFEDAQAREAEDTPTIEKALKRAQQAKKKKEAPVRYAPDNCDFELTFPSAPNQSKRCPQGAKKCYPLTSYTMVYELTSTVDVSVTCVPSTPTSYNSYSEQVIKAALNGMVSRAQIQDFTITTQQKDDYRQGNLIGSATYGKQERIYNAQLWIGQNSIFTVEAKLTGPSHPEADATFSDILKSIQVKEEAEEDVTEKKSDEESEDEESDDEKDAD